MTEIYTDGGCSGNPGPGGWAYVIIEDDDPAAENWGAEKSTTNNRMELLAVISALEEISRTASRVTGEGPGGNSSGGNAEITVYTDSQYVQKGMTEWLANWKRNSWRTSGKESVKNQDLWQRLDALASGFSIKWSWVKGHAGNKYNEKCDALTQKAIASLG